MKLVEKVKRVWRNPRQYVDYLLTIWLSPLFPDRMYIKLLSKFRFGKSFDLEHPKTFNEKLNWIKLHDRKPVYTRMADKLTAKQFAAEHIGQEYIVPLYGSWNSVEEIDFDSLPEKCMLKANGDSCGRYVYEKKKGVDMKELQKKLQSAYPFNYYYQSREWPYKNIPRKILAEKFIGNDGQVITDLKWWCFNGKPKIFEITCKEGDVHETFYDEDFKPFMMNHNIPRHVPEFEKPEPFDLTKELAAKLAKDTYFLRCDFMYVKGKVWFAEMTFFDWGGFRPFQGDWDEVMGNYIQLPIE